MASASVIAFFVVIATCILYSHVHGKGKFDWMAYDRFDEIDLQHRSVNQHNCRSQNRDYLTMRRDVVSQLPVYNKLLSQVWYRNRTALIHLHNMALNRAFFNSYILQRMNTSENFMRQPNWMYFYFSAGADVNANPFMINGSSFYFDTDCHYPNWYTTVPFNKTIPLFAPKAYRWDNWADPGNFLREPTRSTVRVDDAGAGGNSNYTHPMYKMNNWYNTWLPDTVGDKDSLTKFTYYIGIKRSNETGVFVTKEYENYAFFGPSSPGASEEDPQMLPVQWTAPYFDCGGRNKWVVSAVSPVIDYMPRYSNFTHLRRQRIIGLVVMDIDFNKVDFNACNVGKGNPGPSYLSGIQRCRQTTSCKFRAGFGFRRGGYTCVCKAGTRYPWHLDPPFMGEDIEQATEQEYKDDFMCLKIDYRLALPVVDQLQGGIQIEGANPSINSAGLILEPDSDDDKRKKRSVSGFGNFTSNTRESEPSNAETQEEEEPELYFQGEDNKYTEEENQWLYNEEINRKLLDHMRHGAGITAGVKGDNKEYTVQEVMDLADKLKEIQDNKDIKKVPSFMDGARRYFGNDRNDYSFKNNVDVEVERQYKEDIKGHEAFKEYVMEYVAAHNISQARRALQDNIAQIRDRHMQRFHGDKNRPHSHRRRKRAAVFDEPSFDRMMRIFRQYASVTAENCHTLPNHQLYLPGDVNFGVETQFEPEGRTALRLSHFLSNYLQNVIPEENYGNLRGGGRLHEDQMIGEVLANVMGNFRIRSAGLYFDRHKFENQDGTAREFFGPWAFSKKGAYYVMDTAGRSTYYTDEDWFLQAKARFQANFFGVRTYKIKVHVRSNPKGESLVKHEYYPMPYRAAPYNLGFWTRPHFRCDGNVDEWVMTYVTPFFGLDSLRTKLEFRGVATVDVPLNLLEINPCPQPFSVANAFKNTARCDYFSTNCLPQAGLPFRRGSYVCKCRLGFEYWHADGKEWFEGSFLEMEYEKKRAGIFSRFDHLYCRPASATALLTSWTLLLLAALTHLL